MKDTYLVQVLTEKPKTAWHAKVSQVFGGGMLMLPEKGWEAIQAICDLKYMGAAEYEFGTIPSVLGALAQDHKELITFPLIIKKQFIKPNWEHEHRHQMRRRVELKEAKAKGVKPPRAKKLVIDGSDKTVYVICRKSQAEEVKQRIIELAGEKHHLKRGDGFARALDPASEYDKEAVGWLELDNGFMWFLRHQEYDGMAELFGLTPFKEEDNAPKQEAAS